MSIFYNLLIGTTLGIWGPLALLCTYSAARHNARYPDHPWHNCPDPERHNQ